jgi:hypothetical protein
MHIQSGRLVVRKQARGMRDCSRNNSEGRRKKAVALSFAFVSTANMDETPAASDAPTTTASTTAPPTTLSFRVVHAKNTIEVALPQDATVLALVDHLQSVTRVPAETMKLMFKGMH